MYLCILYHKTHSTLIIRYVRQCVLAVSLTTVIALLINYALNL